MITSRISVEETAIASYRQRFESAPAMVASAPGRVNLIGEHTDYNDGFVFPAAIDRATAVAIGGRDDDRLVLYSGTVASEAAFPLDRLYPTEQRAWTDYLVGVAALLRARGEILRGANLCVYGTVPRGAGLSSSAALEMAAAFALCGFNGLTLPPLDIIALCQRAEHEFAGVHCGIMDQFIACLGKRSHALMLDCRSLAYDLIPLPPGITLVVCDTTVRRALASSEYNTRRQECAAGVRTLSTRIPGLASLRDLSVEQLEEFGTLLEPVVRKRCRHVVTENARVNRAALALQCGDMSEFGKLMYDSHLSLRVDYAVSCRELDVVVDICAETDGVYGARMTGGGFGGCAICLLRDDDVPALLARLQSEYPRMTGRSPTVHVCAIDDGASVHAV